MAAFRGGATQANLITDVPGLSVGHAEDARIGSGATVVLFDKPATASVAIHGGAAGLRDSALLEPEMTVDKIDALVLSGGSSFGLDAMGGVAALLREQGRGFAVRDIHVPIVPGAIIFDLLNGGEKAWGSTPLYWHLGYGAAAAAKVDFDLGSVGVGLGATLADLKGGIGSASAISSSGFCVGAIVVVNAIGQATIGNGPHFWAAPYERNGEFGGRGWPQTWPANLQALRLKGDCSREYDDRHRRMRCVVDEERSKTPGYHGAGRDSTGATPGACGSGRRYDLRRCDRHGA